MTEGISKERLIGLMENPNCDSLDYAIYDYLLSMCTDLDPWIPIESSIVDNKEYLFVTKNKRQRVDRFHPSQYATVNTDLRWQERPSDRYTHYKLLPEDPK